MTNAVRQLGPQFQRLIALGAEVQFQQDHPRVALASVDFEALRSTQREIGLALRIGPYRGSFSDSAVAHTLAQLAATLVAQANSNHLRLAELQIDFDCPESKLDGYRHWVGILRRRIAPVPLTITALPAWLRQAACRPLVEATDGFILQVHSLEPPRDRTTPFSLCQTDAARAAVEQAATLGPPFRVALPTYGYLVAFDPQGRLLGISAEGPARQWPAGTQLREVRANPSELAGLVNAWRSDRPALLTALLWYRLPVREDQLNWTWPTLSKVMNGVAPLPSVTVEARQLQPGLVELHMINQGHQSQNRSVRIRVQWTRGRLRAGDAAEGFALDDQKSGEALFSHAGPWRPLQPQETRAIGWLRFDQKVEVHVDWSID